MASSSIEEIFRCFICLGRLQNAHLCPHCSKMCCWECIKKWFSEMPNGRCPHCRAPLRLHQMVKCRFMADVTTELEKLSVVPTTAENCALHNNASLLYYCRTCETAVCSDCAMFEEKHKGHEFEKLTDVYERCAEAVQEEAAHVRNRLEELMALSESVEANIDRVTKAKEERSLELRHAMEQVQSRLDEQLKTKLITLIGQKERLNDGIGLLESMLLEIEHQITTKPKSVLIASSEDLARTLRELHHNSPAMVEASAVSALFVSEVVPDYERAVFHLHHYSKLRTLHEVVYSEPLHSNGLTWRLKVYPNGNGVARGTHLSVFLEMVSGAPCSSKYEYRVEMVNHKNCSCVMREYVSDFEVGECWGYNKFFKIDMLAKEGYLLEEEDTLILRFFVRDPTYYQKCVQQQRYIEALENARETNGTQIGELKHKLAVEAQRRKSLQRGEKPKKSRATESPPAKRKDAKLKRRKSAKDAGSPERPGGSGGGEGGGGEACMEAAEGCPPLLIDETCDRDIDPLPPAPARGDAAGAHNSIEAALRNAARALSPPCVEDALDPVDLMPEDSPHQGSPGVEQTRDLPATRLQAGPRRGDGTFSALDIEIDYSESIGSGTGS